MATVFGISGLKSKLDAKWDDWRNGRKKFSESDPALLHPDADLSTVLENLVIPKLIASRDFDHVFGYNPDCNADINQTCDHTYCAPPPLPTSLQNMAKATDETTQPITASEVEIFALLSLEGEASELLESVDSILAAGHSVETIYIDLLAPAARRLGQYWEEDSADFIGVTMGLWRIQEILRELAVRIPSHSAVYSGQRTALFSTLPGEQHSLGTLMVSECFGRAGWETDVLIEPTQSELINKLAKQSFDLVGLTVSNDCPNGALSSLVHSIKSISKNGNIRIMMGGRFIAENPELVALCGADGTAQDAVSAVELADRLVPLETGQYWSQSLAQ